MKHRHIGRTLKLLIARRMITCQGDRQKLEYSLQKDYEQWRDMRRVEIEVPKPVPNGVPVAADSTSTQRGTSGINETSTQLGTNRYPVGDQPVPNGVPKPVPNGVHTKAIKHLTKAIYKSTGDSRAFGELANVKLTPEEHEKLVQRFGAQGATDWIDELSLAKASKGYKTKSDYATILAWERREVKRERQGPIPHSGKKTAKGGVDGKSIYSNIPVIESGQDG